MPSEIKQHTISVLAENKFGALARIARTGSTAVTGKRKNNFRS